MFVAMLTATTLTATPTATLPATPTPTPIATLTPPRHPRCPRYEEVRDRLLSENVSCKRALERVLEELDERSARLATAAEEGARARGEAEALRTERDALRVKCTDLETVLAAAEGQLTAARAERATREDAHERALGEARAEGEREVRVPIVFSPLKYLTFQ